MAKEKTKKVEPKKEVKVMRETPKKKEAKVSRGVEPKKETPKKDAPNKKNGSKKQAKPTLNNELPSELKVVVEVPTTGVYYTEEGIPFRLEIEGDFNVAVKLCKKEGE